MKAKPLLFGAGAFVLVLLVFGRKKPDLAPVAPKKTEPQREPDAAEQVEEEEPPPARRRGPLGPEVSGGVRVGAETLWPLAEADAATDEQTARFYARAVKTGLLRRGAPQEFAGAAALAEYLRRGGRQEEIVGPLRRLMGVEPGDELRAIREMLNDPRADVWHATIEEAQS